MLLKPQTGAHQGRVQPAPLACSPGGQGQVRQVWPVQMGEVLQLPACGAHVPRDLSSSAPHKASTHPTPLSASTWERGGDCTPGDPWGVRDSSKGRTVPGTQPASRSWLPVSLPGLHERRPSVLSSQSPLPTRPLYPRSPAGPISPFSPPSLRSVHLCS